MKIIIRILKLLKWDLSSKIGRFYYFYYFIKSFPGNLGIMIRSLLVKKYLLGVGKNLKVFEGVRIRNIDRLSIGDNTELGVNCFIQAAGGVEIGSDVVIGPDVKIWSANHNYFNGNKPIREQGYSFKKVVIGNNVWIASNSFIMPGAEIRDGCIISAGSIVGAKSYPDNTILCGNPARKIGIRKCRE